MAYVIGSLPRHHYVFVDQSHISSKTGFTPAVWFGLVAYPGRAWGCNVLLESGAVYRNLPPHALAFTPNPEGTWSIQQAQTWDCYGRRFSCLEYEYLSGLDVRVRAAGREYDGEYLFSVAPAEDGFSAYPEQAKEFTFARLDNGRLTIQPTNHVLFVEKSFTHNPELKFPTELRRQSDVWAAE